MDPLSQNISGHYAPEKKTILSLCSNRQGYSIADFARLLDASIPKVTRIVTEMVADGYLVDLGKTGSSGGRRASIFGLNPKAGYFVGVHVEQERITVAATDFPGQLVHAVERMTPLTPPESPNMPTATATKLSVIISLMQHWSP